MFLLCWVTPKLSKNKRREQCSCFIVAGAHAGCSQQRDDAAEEAFYTGHRGSDGIQVGGAEHG